jgi:hypothetical protein
MQFWLLIRIARDARVCLVFHFLITGCSTTVTDGWKQFNGKCWQVTVFSCADTRGVRTELLCLKG